MQGAPPPLPGMKTGLPPPLPPSPKRGLREASSVQGGLSHIDEFSIQISNPPLPGSSSSKPPSTPKDSGPISSSSSNFSSSSSSLDPVGVPPPKPPSSPKSSVVISRLDSVAEGSPKVSATFDFAPPKSPSSPKAGEVSGPKRPRRGHARGVSEVPREEDENTPAADSYRAILDQFYNSLNKRLKCKDTTDETGNTKLINELLSTEKTYVKQLKFVCLHFLLPLKARVAMGTPVLSAQEISDCFLNVGDILDFNRKLYRSLKDLQLAGTLYSSELPKQVKFYMPFFKLYNSYVERYQKAADAIGKLRKQNKAFDQFCKCSEQVLRFMGSELTLASLIITPVQRIPRYVMLLRGVVNGTGVNDQNYGPFKECLGLMEDAAAQMNDALNIFDAKKRVVDIQRLLEPKIELVTPTRMHVRDGHLKKKFKKKVIGAQWQPVWLFLFNDVLMYTTPGLGSDKKKIRCKHMMRLEELTSCTSIDDDPSAHVLEFTWSEKCVHLSANSPEEKEGWIECVNLAKSKLLVKQQQSNDNRDRALAANTPQTPAAAVQQPLINDDYYSDVNFTF